MPNLGDIRHYHGPNGPFNYISDNPRVTVTRDVNDRIVLLDLYPAMGGHIRKTITRDGAGLITAVSVWVRV